MIFKTINSVLNAKSVARFVCVFCDRCRTGALFGVRCGLDTSFQCAWNDILSVCKWRSVKVLFYKVPTFMMATNLSFLSSTNYDRAFYVIRFSFCLKTLNLICMTSSCIIKHLGSTPFSSSRFLLAQLFFVLPTLLLNAQGVSIAARIIPRLSLTRLHNSTLFNVLKNSDTHSID